MNDYKMEAEKVIKEILESDPQALYSASESEIIASALEAAEKRGYRAGLADGGLRHEHIETHYPPDMPTGACKFCDERNQGD